MAHRCPCGLPDVVETAPRLPDGTPFPTLYYLTCPRAIAAVSRLEAAGMMRTMAGRLAEEADLRQDYEAAHRDYLTRRDAVAHTAAVQPLPPGTQSAGGMPDRVKCLHALVAHELAVPGNNPPAGRRCRLRENGGSRVPVSKLTGQQDHELGGQAGAVNGRDDGPEQALQTAPGRLVRLAPARPARLAGHRRSGWPQSTAGPTRCGC